MSYLRFALRRIPQMLLTLFGLSMLIFTMVRIVPGDPVRAAIGPGAPEETYEAYAQELYLDEPLPIQYLYWLRNISQGTLGESIRSGNDVASELVVMLPATLEIIFLAFAFALVFGIPLGVISGLNKDGLPDHFSRVLALSGISFPRFWLAIVLQIIFVGWLSMFPLRGRIGPGMEPAFITGMYTVDSLLIGDITAFMSAIHHLILPAIALGFSTLAEVTRMTRSEMIDVNRTDYILAARSYGLPSNLIAYKYMLKNAFSASLTILGTRIGGMLAGATFVELIFDINGIGRYAIFAILRLDFNAITGVVIVIGTAYLVGNSLVDLLYGYLDPRVRES